MPPTRPLPTRGPPSRPPTRPVVSSREPLHLPLHRRLLFPTAPLDRPIPPLITAPGSHLTQINERVYHLIALALRAYVLSWYTRISPRDRTLLPVLHATIIAPILSPILQGIQDDPSRLADLILLDLPTALKLHLQTLRHARTAIELQIPGAPNNLAAAYHARLPLLSVSSALIDGKEQYTVSALYLTALSDALVKLYIPTEVKPQVERLMLREILGRAILGGVARRLVEPWFWHQVILKLLGEPGTAHSQKEKVQRPTATEDLGAFLARIWTMLLSLWTMAASLMAFYSAAPPTKDTYVGCHVVWIDVLRELSGVETDKRWARRWIFGIIEALISLVGPMFDRLAPHMMQERVLTPTLALKVCDLVERLLFPLDGYPAPTPPDPGPEEQADLRRRTKERVSELLPSLVRKSFYLSTDETAQLLSVIGNSGCNAHLVGLTLDAVVGALVPELVATGQGIH